VLGPERVGNEEILAEHVKYVIRGTTFPTGTRSHRATSVTTSRATLGSAHSNRLRRPCSGSRNWRA
jgi:hypothetical protein